MKPESPKRKYSLPVDDSEVTKLRKLYKNIPNDLNILLNVTDQWNPEKSNIHEFLKKVITDPYGSIELLDTCKCCPRHKINRPKFLNANREFESLSSLNSVDKCLQYNCECNCRHLSRFICRTFCGNTYS